MLIRMKSNSFWEVFIDSATEATYLKYSLIYKKIIFRFF